MDLHLILYNHHGSGQGIRTERSKRSEGGIDNCVGILGGGDVGRGRFCLQQNSEFGLN